MRATGWLAATLLVLWLEPALANKFDTIGSGVAGPTGLKREWLRQFFFILAGAGALGAFLALVYPHKNALFLNATNWKRSAMVMGTFSALSLIAALAL